MDDAAAPLCDLPDPAARAQALLLRQVERLDELAEEGLRMARLIREQVSADPANAPSGAVTAFSRLAKAVRLCGLLQTRLVKDMEDARRRRIIHAPMDEREAALAAARERARLDPAHDHKARVEKIVERQVRARHPRDEDEVERLMMEACDRLDDEDIYRDVLTRPVGELVSRICRDLGVDPDWERLSEEAWAIDEIASGTPNSPFNRLDSARPPPFAAANGGGGPSAAEPMVVGENHIHPPPNSPTDRPHAWSG